MGKYLRRLPVPGAYNIRELGGYPAKDGKITAFGKFIRADLLGGLGEEGIEYLKNYGVRSSMDFRSGAERSNRPSVFEPLEFITYKAAALIEQFVAGPLPKYVPPENKTWDQIYIEMVESKPEWTRTAIEFAAECPDALIYNCRTGKDRTGVFTAYLLSIAGVPREDIIADYCISQVYLEPFFEAERKYRPDLPPDSLFFKTPPSAMDNLLLYFQREYGGTEGFLKNCGVTDAHIKMIREKLLTEGEIYAAGNRS